MSRLLPLTLAAVGVLVLGGAVAMLAYGAEPQRDGTLRLGGLTGEATLSWSATGEVSVDATTEDALWSGLGYAHAADHGWSIALWRQAALGRLSLWAGADALDADRHARRLGFARLAQETYRQMPVADREAVDAYARGIRLAFRDNAVAERDEFVQLDVDLEAWEPWHALAIERMIAWLGTATLPSGLADASSFRAADSLFRETLALDGLHHARAFAAPARWGEQRAHTLVYHQPYGASALPLLVGTRLSLDGQEQVVATIPGTLSLPASTSGWAVFLTSEAMLVRTRDAAPPPLFSRLVDRDGNESLLEVRRDTSGLVLVPASVRNGATEAETPQPDGRARTEADGLRLQWRGFAPGSDVTAFRDLLLGRSASFRLLRGDGLSLVSGTARVMGQPPDARSGTGWSFTSASTQGRMAPLRLAALAADPNVTATGLAEDVGSPWALRQVQRFADRLGNRDSLPLDLQDPYAFLRGWDGLYTPEAIAPSIAEAWMEAHRGVMGRQPDGARPTDSLLAPHTLRLGLSRLRDSLGTRPNDWAWGRLAERLRHPLLGVSRGGSVSITLAGGHPSAPLPGPSLIFDAPPGAAVFSFWTNGIFARTDHPALHVVRTTGRDARVIRTWSRPTPDRPTLRLLPA